MNERAGEMPVMYKRPISYQPTPIHIAPGRKKRPGAYEAVATDLPFLLHDFKEINQIFSHWYVHRGPEALRIIDTWTYCFVGRFLTSRFEQAQVGCASDQDQLIGRTLFKIQDKRDSIREPGCYAAWVVIVCKNNFHNFVRLGRTMVGLDQHQVLYVNDAKPENEYDTTVIHRAVADVIASLPPFLRDVAELRFVEQLTYHQISSRVQKPITTVRTYVCRIKRIFSAHPVLAEFRRSC